MNRKLILLVEDNPDDETLALRALQKNKIVNQIAVARDGAEALDFVYGTGAYLDRDTSVTPQLILLDLMLPKMDGFEVLRRLRADPRSKFIPVVILTASNEMRDRIRAYSLGANSFVQKPVQFDEFVDSLRQLDSYWLLLNQAVPSSGRL